MHLHQPTIRGNKCTQQINVRSEGENDLNAKTQTTQQHGQATWKQKRLFTKTRTVLCRANNGKYCRSADAMMRANEKRHQKQPSSEPTTNSRNTTLISIVTSVLRLCFEYGKQKLPGNLNRQQNIRR